MVFVIGIMVKDLQCLYDVYKNKQYNISYYHEYPGYHRKVNRKSKK